MTPKVSIIVPVYNVEKYLNRCIESLVHQTLKEIEIILVDDLSPDKSPQMCDEWAKKDPRIKVIHKERNEGLGFARNTGLDYAVGECVTFCDSDDWVEEETYDFVYNKVKEKKLDVCWFQSRRVSVDGSSLENGNDVNEEYFDTPQKMENFRLDMIGRNPEKRESRSRGMSSCMALFRRTLFVSSGVRYPSERVVASEDFIFLLDFLKHVHRVGIIPNVFYNYRINPASISQTYPQEKHNRLIHMLEMTRHFCETNYEWNVVKNHYYGQLLRIIKHIIGHQSRTKDTFKYKVQMIERDLNHPLLKEFLSDSVCYKFGKETSCLVFMMKHKMTAVLVLLCQLKK